MRDIQDSFICQSQKSGFILLPDTSPNLKSTLTIRGLKEFVYVLVQWETWVKPSTSNNTFLQSTNSQKGILIYSSFPVQKSSPFIIHKWHHSRSQSHTHTPKGDIPSFPFFVSLFISPLSYRQSLSTEHLWALWKTIFLDKSVNVYSVVGFRST